MTDLSPFNSFKIDTVLLPNAIDVDQVKYEILSLYEDPTIPPKQKEKMIADLIKYTNSMKGSFPSVEYYILEMPHHKTFRETLDLEHDMERRSEDFETDGVKCINSSCGSTKTIITRQQLRSGDEGATRIRMCVQCGSRQILSG